MVTMEEEDDVDKHIKGKGLSLPLPVLLEEGNDITMDDIERMVENAPAFDDQSKTPERIRAELEEMHEIVQEFTRGKDPRTYKNKQNGPHWSRKKVNMDRMNEILMAVMDDHSSKVTQSGELMEKDIPHLLKEWMKSCKDIMSGVPERLPPSREVNHRIPLIDDTKKYKYHALRCLDSLKTELGEKIAHYTRAGWWELAQVKQAAPMLCVPKKNSMLRTVVNRRQQNNNTVKDITPLPD